MNNTFTHENDFEEIKAQQQLKELQKAIIKQVEQLKEWNLPANYSVIKFNLTKAIDLYFKTCSFSMDAGIGNYTEAINDAIMVYLKTNDETNKFVCQDHEYMADVIFRLTDINTYITKACEIVSQPVSQNRL